MKIAIPKEEKDGERRVAATPDTVRKYRQAAFDVTVEKGAGLLSSIPDEAYERAGARLEDGTAGPCRGADIVLKVGAPGTRNLEGMKEGTVLISFLEPLVRHDLIRELARRKITAFSMEMIPRIARAQKMDALSSQGNIAGYKAVVLAANAGGKLWPMLMTAAGTIQPARVLVLGAGVAGLQAVATAKRLGARVEAFDTRPQVKEQVESLGAKFLTLDLGQGDTEDNHGYAKELSEASHQKETALIAEHAKEADVVITTALIPGRPAPLLLAEDTVRQMRPGAVIVDLAAEQGGNCALTEPGKAVERHGVKILGFTQVPSLMAEESSRLYARNVMNFLLEMWDGGTRDFRYHDDVVKETLITRGGQIVHPRIRELAGTAGSETSSFGPDVQSPCKGGI